ncbi:MAG: hypothetical protein AAGA55_00870 [Planctomycetota bacterium]
MNKTMRRTRRSARFPLERTFRRGLVAAWMVWTLGWTGTALMDVSWYATDLLAAYQAQMLIPAACLLLWCLLRRGRMTALLTGLGILVATVSLAPGRAISVPGVDLVGVRSDEHVRVVSLNIHPQNEHWRDDLERIFSWSPDVVILIETPPDLWRGLVRRGELRDTAWSNHVYRSWVDELATPCFVLSRWPIERLAFDGIEHAERDVLIARVDRPDGAMLVGAAHPHSPRDERRWRLGHVQTRTTVDAVRGVLKGSDEPLVIGADLNSGPAGHRSLMLRGSGLRMSKPLFGGGGSYPAGLAAPLRVQLDDVWRSSGVRVAGWSSVGGFRSDHRAVVVDLVLPD